MKVTDLWSPGKKPTVSFELFPARSEKGAVSLEKAINELSALKPDFVSVTFGAGPAHLHHGSQHLGHRDRQSAEKRGGVAVGSM